MEGLDVCWCVRPGRSGFVEVRGEEHVLADRLGAEAVKRSRPSELAEQQRARARERRCDEEEELVDEVGLEERGRERRAALEEQCLDALLAERGELLRDRPAAQL